VAIGFDDGPWFFTPYVLDELKRFNAHATFFVNPAPRILDTNKPYWAPIIRRMHEEGHQVALHGYAHEHFDVLTPDQRLDVLARSAAFFAQPTYLNGLTPTYMRPPWGECDDRDSPNGCLDGVTAAGYRVVFWDLDPRDWESDSVFEIHKSIEIVDSALAPTNANPAVDSFLVVAHDVHLQTAINLTQAMLQTIERRGFRPVTVGECIGEPREAWYRHFPLGGSAPQRGNLPSSVSNVWAEGSTTGWTFAVLGLMAFVSVFWALRTYSSLRRKNQARWNDVPTRKV
jgi:peptidoglycan/xylan/chitin deacetylase (PgdA/CDA1 family)